MHRLTSKPARAALRVNTSDVRAAADCQVFLLRACACTCLTASSRLFSTAVGDTRSAESSLWRRECMSCLLGSLLRAIRVHHRPIVGRRLAQKRRKAKTTPCNIWTSAAKESWKGGTCPNCLASPASQASLHTTRRGGSSCPHS